MGFFLSLKSCLLLHFFNSFRIPIHLELGYSEKMFRMKQLFFLFPAVILLMTACGFVPGQQNASDVADAFYNFQLTGEGPFPHEMFSDKKLAAQAETLISRREMAYGSLVSHKRTGTNRRVSIEGTGRKESVTYIFEVFGENGKTRETLMLSRCRKSDPFLISAYVIEDIPHLQDPAPAGTSST